MHPDMVSIADLTTWSNKKAYLCNAGEGGTQYPDWTKFTVDEVMAFHGLYMHNGLSPSPQVEKKFEHPKKNEVKTMRMPMRAQRRPPKPPYLNLASESCTVAG